MPMFLLLNNTTEMIVFNARAKKIDDSLSLKTIEVRSPAFAQVAMIDRKCVAEVQSITYKYMYEFVRKRQMYVCV